MSSKGLFARPCTAPTMSRRPKPEQWFEVDAVVRNMLFNAASTATSSTAQADPLSGPLPPRPHTACAGARATVVVLEPPATDSDESDGASFDEDESLAPPPRSAQGKRSGREAAAPTATGLTREQELLLSGALWGRIGSSMPSRQKGGTDKAAPAPSPEASTAAPSSSSAASVSGSGNPGSAKSSPSLGDAARKLPRQCVFVGSPAGSRPSTGQRTPGRLMPNAARYKSHCSWASFLPMRTPGATRILATSSTPPAAQAAEVSAPTASPKPEAVAEAVADAVTAVAGASTDLAAGAPPAVTDPAEGAPFAAPPAAAPLCEELSHVAVPRRRGPKYKVVPGSSRPAAVTAAKVPREVVVLEFRTEPRVVPATRTSREATSKGAPKKGSTKDNRREMLRFRPDSRNWAREREALAHASR